MPTFLENGVQVVDQELIDDVVHRIVERFYPKRIVLFGSRARGDADPESDIDLFIEMESDLRPIDRAVEVASLFAAGSVTCCHTSTTRGRCCMNAPEAAYDAQQAAEKYLKGFLVRDAVLQRVPK